MQVAITLRIRDGFTHGAHIRDRNAGVDELLAEGLPGEDEAGDVQRITAEHAAHGVGNEGDHLVAFGAHVVATLHALGHVFLCIEHAVDGHVPVRHLRGQLILQAVDVDEDAVEFFFVGFELLETFFTFGLPSFIAINQFIITFMAYTRQLNCHISCTNARTVRTQRLI